jgi:hypothetical protein
MRPIETLLARFPDAKKSGNGWSARCPANGTLAEPERWRGGRSALWNYHDTDGNAVGLAALSERLGRCNGVRA